MTANPAKLSGKNPAPPPRSVRVFMPSELEALCEEFDTRGAAAITFAAATGLRPSEWAHVERRDIDRTRRILHRARHEDEAIEARGTADLHALSLRSTRSSPASTRPTSSPVAEARPVRPSQLPPARVEPGRRSRRESTKPARLYDLRSTFASNALSTAHRVRARPDHGNERRDDRGALRRTPRHRARVAPRAPGRRFGHESGMTRRAETPDDG